MSKFKIQHTTRYLYEDAVRDSANQIMLYPIRDQYQDVLQHTIQVTGNPIIHIHTDYFGNQVGTFTFVHTHRELIIDSQLMVLTKTRALPEDKAPATEQWQELKNIRWSLEYADFLKQEELSTLPEIKAVVESQLSGNSTPFQAAKHFSEYIYRTFEYRKGITTVETTPDEIWKLKSGVCQDFAHILLVMLRQLGIPARYVSGYICPKKNGMRGEGATHAWVEGYIPFYGWLGLDPTNNCVVNETHVRLAVGKNFLDCSPVKGTYRGTSNHTLDVTVTVAYEDGDTITQESIIKPPPPVSTSVYKNSFRKHQEMQMQQ
jgi:transglutaminase-like putative cysteine protease